MRPTMIVVAGPPGSGKSSIFPVSKFGTPYLNADDRAAELNGGSYLAIPKHIRQIVNQEFESFLERVKVREMPADTPPRREPSVELIGKPDKSFACDCGNGLSLDLRQFAVRRFADVATGKRQRRNTVSDK